MKKHIRLTMLALALAAIGASAQASPAYAYYTPTSGLKATAQPLNPPAPVAEASVTLAPGHLDFGVVDVGVTGASQSVVLSNPTSAAVSVAGVSVVGGAAEFGQANACGGVVPAGGNCVIAVAMTPALSGGRSGVLSAVVAGQAYSVSLTGAGSAANPSVAPGSLDFSQVPQGGHADQAVSLTNGGPGTVRVDSATLSDAGQGFSILTDACTNALLASGASCSMAVRFSPTDTAIRTASLQLKTSASAPSDSLMVALSGSGVLAAAWGLSATSHDFGAVAVGKTGSFTLTVSNTGTASTSISVTGLAAPFSRSGGTCGSALAAGASCTVGVVFTPSDLSQSTSKLTLTGSMGAGTQSVTFTGAGAAAVGQRAYTTAGTYTWTAPAFVTRVSVVAVGGGGSCSTTGNNGGAGGGLGWRNNIAVTPGATYTVVVGAYGNKASNYGPGQAGGDSYFGSASLVRGGGGGLSTSDSVAASGGSFVGDGGGNGGAGGKYISVFLAGGGGAGGYAGSGGGGAAGISSGSNGQDGAGGGGGGGGSGNGSAGGGGVGLTGQGANGLHGSFGQNWTDTGGQGGSGGTSGSNVISGGAYGGGGGCASAVNWSVGGVGAVRIIWGDNRAFPATNTADQ